MSPTRRSLEQLLQAVTGEFGSVQVLVNSAGRTKRTPTLEVPESEWNGILETNLNGTLRACQVFGRHMIERGYGRIINIASLSSFVALYEVAAYSASKGKTGKFCTIFPFDDTDIYKTIEGASFSLSLFPDTKLEAYIDSLIAIIGKAQEPDGYLYTARTIDPNTSSFMVRKRKMGKGKRNEP